MLVIENELNGSSGRRREAPLRFREAQFAGAREHRPDRTQQRYTEKLHHVLGLADAAIAHFDGECGADSEHAAQKYAQ